VDLNQVQADLAAVEADGSLDGELNLAARLKTLSQLDFADEVVRLHAKAGERAALARRIDAQRARLEQVNGRLYEETWARVQATVCAARTRDGDREDPARRELRAWLDRFTAYRPRQGRPVHAGYDALDALIDGAFNLNEVPAPTQKAERDMIHLEPTPARVVLELVDRVEWRPTDLFYDVGSGLGQVPILVHLLAGVRAVGVEIEPAYCRVARATAAALGLAGVSVVQGDARQAAYGQGTVFYLFTPFVGQMLQVVLDRLRVQTQGRAVTLCCYGPCCPHVARQGWLRSLVPDPEHEFKLALFERAG
jgi:SAM-dependent methyltransferase